MKRMELRWISILLVAIMLLTGLPAALAEGYDIVVTQADGAGVELNGMDLDDQLELGEDAIIAPDGVLAEGLELDLDILDGDLALAEPEGEATQAVEDDGEWESNASGIPTIRYQAHSQKKGWLATVSSGATAGTTGQSLRMEALKITLSDKNTSMVKYRAHVSGTGWQSWKKSGEMAGTTGQGRALEAVQIQLQGSYAKKYDIYYRVHASNRGWLGWAKNGAMAGSTGMAIGLEAIQIRLVGKNSKFSTGGSPELKRPTLSYRAHCQDKGWMGKILDGGTAGTTGKSKRLEALRISLKDFDGKSAITYRAFVNNQWQNWRDSDKDMGTTGQSRAIEAVEIKLGDSLAPFFDLYYRMHVANLGWLGWARSGEPAGSTGGGVQAEAIQIRLVNKGAKFDRGGYAWHDWARTEAIRLKHYMDVSMKQSYSGPCCAYAYAIGLSVLLKQSFDPFTFYYGGLCHYDKGHVGEYLAFDGAAIYANLKAGKPTMVHYRFGKGGQHWVVVIGVNSGALIDRLSPGDFIVIDPNYGDERQMTQALGYATSNSYAMKLFY